jgi:voltage-gated potassium channel Kch
VTLSTVAGVICLYLLLGIMFAQLYQAGLELTDDAFIYSEALTRFDLVYFSFVTLTTVGFGDIVPGIDATRALAATEAISGQLFLVTVVARVISMLGQERMVRARAPEAP